MIVLGITGSKDVCFLSVQSIKSMHHCVSQRATFNVMCSLLTTVSHWPTKWLSLHQCFFYIFLYTFLSCCGCHIVVLTVWFQSWKNWWPRHRKTIFISLCFPPLSGDKDNRMIVVKCGMWSWSNVTLFSRVQWLVYISVSGNVLRIKPTSAINSKNTQHICKHICCILILLVVSTCFKSSFGQFFLVHKKSSIKHQKTKNITYVLRPFILDVCSLKGFEMVHMFAFMKKKTWENILKSHRFFIIYVCLYFSFETVWDFFFFIFGASIISRLSWCIWTADPPLVHLLCRYPYANIVQSLNFWLWTW